MKKKRRITGTKAARNFADCVNHVRYQNASFVLLKNGVSVAHLVPESEKVCTGRELAKALAEVKLSPKEARAWLRDIRTARKHLKAPRDKWRE